jgi:Zn-dependent protease with chaperone function
VFLVLLGVSASLALADNALKTLGFCQPASEYLLGSIAGFLVFGLACAGGWLLRFCARRIVDDPGHQAKILAALSGFGAIVKQREFGKTTISISEGQGSATPNSLLSVCVVDSRRFVAVTTRAGRSHQVFVSTRLLECLTPEALRGVLAHELGHIDNRHPLKQACVLGLAAGVKFAFGVPLAAVVAVLFAYLYMLREWEFAADAAAVKRTCPADVLTAFEGYRQVEGGQDMSWLSELFCGHPGFQRRIRALQSNRI